MADTKETKKTVKTANVVKTIVELRAELETKLVDQLETRRSHAAGELINPRVLTHLRKDIARLNTAIRAAELAEQKESN